MKNLARLLIVCLLVFAALLVSNGSNVQAVFLAVGRWATLLDLDFGMVGVGASGTRMIVAITNSGSVVLTGWAGGIVPAPFNAVQDCNIQGGLLPGNSCHFYYTFSPTSVGDYSATSTFSTNAGSISIKLQGQGLYGVFLPSIER